MGEGELETNEETNEFTNETNEFSNFTNEANASTADPSSDKPVGDGPRLPVQLARLPASKLRDVYKALEQLEEVGFTSLDAIETLKESVKTKAGMGSEKLPSDWMTSTYMYMCLWAWTRARWMKAVDDPKPMAKLAGASPDEDVADRIRVAEQDEAVASSFDWDAEAPKRVARARGCFERLMARGKEKRDADPNSAGCFGGNADEHFQKWFDAQIFAGKQIKKLGDPDWTPETRGVGQSTFFQYSADTVAAKAYEKPKPKKTREPAALPAGGRGTTARVAPQVITLHVGGAGCGLGVATWNRLFQEHKLGENGRPLNPETFGTTSTHFEESASGRLVPRAVFADTDPAGLEAAGETGCFAPVDLCEGGGGTDTNYARGNYQEKDLCDSVMERIRQHAEKCGSLQGFMITHAVHGGTGGGLASSLLSRMCVDFGRKTRWNVALTPPMTREDVSMNASLCTVLSMHGMLEYCDLTTLMDNTALHKLCQSKQGLGISSPTFADYNALASRVLVAGTSPPRLGSSISASEGSKRVLMKDILTNLTPYPRIHFNIASTAPLINEAMADFATDAAGDSAFKALTKGDLSTVKKTEGKNISIAVLARNLAHSEAIASVGKFKCRRDCQFVDWCPTGFLVGSHRDPTCTKAGDVVCLYNNSAMGGLFSSWNEPFMSNESWEAPASFLEAGMEKGEIDEAINDTAALVQDYVEVAADTCTGEEEGEEEY